MEGKNIYLSVFPEFLGLLSFCLLKLTKNIDLQVMRVTMIFRITMVGEMVQNSQIQYLFTFTWHTELAPAVLAAVKTEFSYVIIVIITLGTFRYGLHHVIF